MNIKINKQVLTVLALGATLALSSCHSDLDRMPTNITSPDKVYATAEGTKQALAKVYGTYSMPGDDVVGQNSDFTDFIRTFYNLQELPTDESVCGWSDGGVRDFHAMNWSSANPFLKGMYYRSIAQIKLANEFLKNTASKAGDAEVRQYRAEVRFLRAFQYWVLMDLFANPPFIAEELGVGLVYPTQKTSSETFAYIEDELKVISSDLAAPKTNEYGRVDQGAAWALLARLYLNAKTYTGTERYADAAMYAEKVIASGKYSLSPRYEELFLTDNDQRAKEEIILSINYDGVESQAYGGMTYLVNASASTEASSADKGIGKDWGVGGWGGIRATRALGDLFTTGDKRMLMGTRKADMTAIDDFKDGGGYWVYKFRNVSSNGQHGKHTTFADADFPLFRLAEMHLIYAEAAARNASGVDRAKGLGYINALRTRAGVAVLSDAELTPMNVLNERGRELYWECHRRTDLIRYGLFTTDAYKWPWKGGIAGGQAVDAKYNIYPLPSDDVQSNPNLKQNSGY